MTLTDILIALLIAVGLAGIIVPILPGTVLIAAALLIWAIVTGGTTAWVFAGVALAVLAVGTVIKFMIPGKRLKAAVPTSTMLIGGVLGIVGFFVIPVVGLFLGFVLGVYLAELQRVGSRQAWPSTTAALRAVGLSILIELAAAMVAAGIWAAGVVTS